METVKFIYFVYCLYHLPSSRLSQIAVLTEGKLFLRRFFFDIRGVVSNGSNESYTFIGSGNNHQRTF